MQKRAKIGTSPFYLVPHDGLNWYVYCGNNPIRFFDPLGTYYIQDNGEDATYRYTIKKDNIFTIIAKNVAHVFIPESIAGNVEYTWFNIVGGNSASSTDAGNDMNNLFIEGSLSYSKKLFKIMSTGEAVYGICKGIEIFDMDSISLGLLSKANISIDNNDFQYLDRVMQKTYGFIKNNTYFTESLGAYFNNYSAHGIDYELSQSKNPDKLIEKYKSSAVSLALSQGYKYKTAKAISNTVGSFLEDYEKRRNEIFDIYKDYIKE